MSMSKKDYEAIARAIYATQTRYQSPEEVKRELAGKIAAAMSDDSPRFDRARFLKACGVSE